MAYALIIAATVSSVLSTVAAAPLVRSSLGSDVLAKALEVACARGVAPCPAFCTQPKMCLSALDSPSEGLLDNFLQHKPAADEKGSNKAITSSMIRPSLNLADGPNGNATSEILLLVSRVVYDPWWSETWSSGEAYESTLGRLTDVLNSELDVSAILRIPAHQLLDKRAYRLPCCGVGNDRYFGCRGDCGPFSWRNKPEDNMNISENFHWNKTGLAPCCRAGWEFPYGCTMICIKRNGEVRDQEGRLGGHVPKEWHKNNDWRYPLDNGLGGQDEAELRDFEAGQDAPADDRGTISGDKQPPSKPEVHEQHEMDRHSELKKPHGKAPNATENHPCCRKGIPHRRGCDYCIRKLKKSSPIRQGH